MYTLGFISPDLMQEMAEEAQAQQDAIDTGPQQPEEEKKSYIGALAVGLGLLWFLTRKS